MNTKLLTTALFLGVATSIDQGVIFGRDNPFNKGNNAPQGGNAVQHRPVSQLGNQGGARAIQNQVRNQVQNQQQNQQQFRQNFNQQSMQHQNQINQQVNQNRNLINQNLNHAQQQNQFNQLNQAPKIPQANPNPLLNQRSNQVQNQLNQNQNQLNKNLQNFGQNNSRPGSNVNPFSQNGGANTGAASGLQPGGTGNLTLKPNLNQNSEKQNQIRNQIQQHQQQRQQQNQQQNQNQLNVNKNPGNKPFNQPLNSNLQQNLNQHLNNNKLNNLNNLNNKNSLNNALNRNNQNLVGPKSLNPQHLQHLQKHIQHNQTVGLNNLAHHKNKVIGGKGFTPLYAVGHNQHHHSGNAQHQFIANKLNFGKGQIYLGKSNYQPSFHHHPNWYKGYWNLYGNNFVGGYPYGSYGYLPYFWGLGGWGLGSLAYGCGYTQYYNPYYVVTPTTIVYDYAQPIPVAYNDQVVSYDPNEGTTTDQILGSAIAAFKLNNYDQALDLVNSGIAKNPDDAVLHEFRALVLFAKGDYQQAAATIHSVLAVGPGWDWTTLSSMYSDVGVYTMQLRALEAAAKSNPDDAASRFLLAYHYMSDGYPDAAAGQLQKVVALVPNDQVSANLLKMLTPNQQQNAQQDVPPLNDIAQPKPDPGIDLPAPGALDETPAAPIDPAMIQGEWKASRDDGSSFSLKLAGDNSFSWTFASKQQQPQSFEGKYTLEGNTIALERDGGGSMVAELTKKDDSSFNFKMVGAPDEDPGLNFVR